MTQAGLFIARRNRRARQAARIPQFLQVQVRSASALPVASIATGTLFPDRTGLITFATAIEITANGGQHRGIVFELGSSTTGVSLWVGDQTIGFHAGASGTADGATALYDLGAELPVGWRVDLVAAVNAGTGEVRLWGNGVELARSRATNRTFASQLWSDSGNGSFASAKNGTVVAVPVASDQAPAGFTVIKPLNVYLGSVPRGFASNHSPKQFCVPYRALTLTGLAPTVTTT